ncbi:MAG: hypothetical protein HYS25_06395 [Ignavibacteriales bacterium]|nr:hypothetical protein [Ignavibacteriales bacterium]
MITFYFSEAFRIFKRSPFSTIVTISITTLAIILTTASVSMIFLSNEFSERVLKRIEVTAYISEGLDQQTISNVKNEFAGRTYISSVRFISKDEAAEEFIRETGEDFRKVLNENPLPNSFVIKFKHDMINQKNFDRYLRDISSTKGIDDVVYDYNVIMRILRIFQSAKVIVYALSLVLILLSIYLVYTNNKLQLENRKSLYATMKLVGARLNALKIPFYINGIIIGFISAAACIIINYLILTMLTAVYNNLKFSHQIFTLHIFTFSIGIFLGLVGSYFSSLNLTLKVSDLDK